MPTQREQTDVYKWLKDNNAKEFSTEFYNEGYYDVKDVNEDAVNKIVKNQGTRNRLLRSLAELNMSVEKAKVSDKEIQHDLIFKKDETKVPELKKPGTGEVEVEMEDPAHLSSEQWAEEIIGPLQLLKGWCVDGATPQPANKIAFELNQKDAIPNFQRYPTSMVEASLAYTDRSSKFISSGFDRETATGTYDFVSLSGEHAHMERQESQSEQRILYITGFWKVNAAKLWFTRGQNAYDIRPTSEFTKDVDLALEEGDLPGDRYLKLCKVFKDYGQVFVSQVTLGGQLFFQHKKCYESTMKDEEERRTVKAAVNLKIAKFSGEAGAEFSKGTAEYEKAVALAESEQFIATGGNPLHAQRPDRWLASLAPHNNWYRISLDEIKPIYELLDEERQDKIKKVLDFVISDPPMRLRRFIMESEERYQHHATCTLTVPPGYKIISGGARVINDEPSGHDTILNMLLASYPTKVDGQDTWRAESWDCKVPHRAHLEISVIALYDPQDEWDVKVFKDDAGSPPKQGNTISVAVDPGYYLTGGGADVFDSERLKVKGDISSFLVASFPKYSKEEDTWIALSHDHLFKDRHKLMVYAIGVKPKNGQLIDIQYWSQASREEQYPFAEAKPSDHYTLVGGGAKSDKELDHHLLASYPSTTSDEWRATSWKAHSTDHERKQPAILTAYAIGVKGAIYPENLPGA